MSVARLGAGVAACGGFLYVVGGYDGQTRWNTAERYQPDTNTWHQLAPMSTTRSGLGKGQGAGAGSKRKMHHAPRKVQRDFSSYAMCVLVCRVEGPVCSIWPNLLLWVLVKA